jgi:hypothetical protein
VFAPPVVDRILELVRAGGRANESGAS